MVAETAIDPFRELVIASWTSEDIKTQVQLGIQACLENGVTTAHALEDITWPAYCQLAEEDALPIRIFYSAYYSQKDKDSFPEYAGVQKGEFLTCDRIKLFADGSLGGCTAALSQNYRGMEDKGILVHPQVGVVLHTDNLQLSSR